MKIKKTFTIHYFVKGLNRIITTNFENEKDFKDFRKRNKHSIVWNKTSIEENHILLSLH